MKLLVAKGQGQKTMPTINPLGIVSARSVFDDYRIASIGVVCT